MEFDQWFMELCEDCIKCGAGRRLTMPSFLVWVKIWEAGVEPTVAAICQWARQDPERFSDLKETERAFRYHETQRAA